MEMKSKRLDLVGIFAAGLCMLHCLLFPLLMVLPIGLSHNVYIDLIFMSIGFWVVFRVTKNVTSRILRYAFWTGIGLIAVSILLDLFFHVHSLLIYAGSVVLILAHIVNYRNHKH